MGGLLLLAASLNSCRSTQYVPVESVRYDSVYINRTSVDTLLQRDSVYIHERGDTTYIEKFRTLYRTSLRHDTSYIERVDTIRVPYPVEAKITKWQRLKMDFGEALMLLLVIGAVALILYIIIRSRNNK
jgi:hypothetical protein